MDSVINVTREILMAVAIGLEFAALCFDTAEEDKKRALLWVIICMLWTANVLA